MKHNFKQLSQLAAEVERAGDLGYASELWRRAYLCAENPANQDYCMHRMEFCTHWKKGEQNGN